MKKVFKKTRRMTRKVVKNCIFCKQKIEPDYKEVDALSHFMNERGKIIPRSTSGICQKHQRVMALSIKHARHLALIPFLVRPGQ